MTQYFHFTLGPVQSFVAQARRTRDFWAGSFILSWLAAVAMKAVQQQKGKILFPLPDDDFLQALEKGGKGPQQGNIPNRFKAEVDQDFKPDLVTETVQVAWQALAEKVWQADLKPVLSEEQSKITEEIWQRQIGSFWEMTWAISSDDNASDLLDRRKNWRTHLPKPEPGVKCMLMDGWQELSGLGWPDRAKLNAFWQPLQQQMKTDLREGEQLSALAFIKRRFVRHFAKLDAQMPNGWRLKGWTLPANVPSIAYLAAAPWLAEVIKQAGNNANISEAFWNFHDVAQELTKSYGEYRNNLRCVKEAVAGYDRQKRWKWTSLDGDVFFEAALDNPIKYPDRAQAQTTKAALKALRKAVAGMEPVSPFYAVLLMDGDSLGQQMSDPNNQEPISKALNAFTQQVKSIVDRHSGFLVYAGGDDVLALLPLEFALACAADLRKHYLGCMTEQKLTSTLSGAIEYAHIRMPLTSVLADAHPLLDDIAKDERGRDAIACRIWKPGGLQQTWSMPWEKALNEDQDQVVIDQLAKQFAHKDAEFANRFFYHIRERFALLNPTKTSAILDQKQAIKLMAADYINSGIHHGRADKITQAETEKIVTPLLDQCRIKTRIITNDSTDEDFTEDPCLTADGALLVRFLAQKGIERSGQ